MRLTKNCLTIEPFVPLLLALSDQGMTWPWNFSPDRPVTV